MDTSTHVITGVGLAGISFIDPTIGTHPELLSSMLFCTIVGSNAPDVDFLYKYKGNDTYLKKHRGISHSLYFQVILAFLIASIATIGNGGSYFPTFFLWTLIAVSLHVLFDICNIYGTQAFRPFTNRWVALNLLPILDPFIMAAHLIGIGFWFGGYHSGMIFSFVYIGILMYVAWRYRVHQNVLRRLIRDGEKGVTYTLLPTFRSDCWGVIASCNQHFKLGKYDKNGVVWSKVLMKASDKNEIIQASRKHSFIKYLQTHSAYMHASIINKEDGYEVHWFDLRYQWKIDEPFIAIIKLDKKLNFVQSDVKRGLLAIPERA
ncbi:metal-dependent hydrolase [Robertmurraya kyonggiensis]|uniref:Metal-dependent hydrolase n=1 Tax=Robertmurraya kyonggiensis TaxID=1037680 RepID=A0A4U1D3W0_9BACI|nr:metal-dependent hydrolase [Robertmurraya kyonggiensis]TKC16393.1 metal-dependent hydrolase [Robertmurraya kyonggiensis]